MGNGKMEYVQVNVADLKSILIRRNIVARQRHDIAQMLGHLRLSIDDKKIA